MARWGERFLPQEAEGNPSNGSLMGTLPGLQSNLHALRYSHNKVQISLVACSKSHERFRLPIKLGIQDNHPHIQSLLCSGFSLSPQACSSIYLNSNSKLLTFIPITFPPL